MKNFFNYFWEWLDGNKTLFGALIIALTNSGLLPEHTFLFLFLQWVGPILAGGGFIHKLFKGRSNT